ncbi:MAG: hypothetical protein R6V58_15820 [Planctomycetota bacterium]
MGVPRDKVNDDRLYRALEAVLPHKTELETFLKNRLGDLFGLEYDLLPHHPSRPQGPRSRNRRPAAAVQRRPGGSSGIRAGASC